MATKMNDYELMLIYNPVLTQEEFKAAQDKIKGLITQNGGQIVHENVWGLRTLAYPIAKKTSAFYLVLEYSAPSELNAKLTVEMNRDEQLLRHMITVLDKYAVAYNEKKRNAPAKAKSTDEVTEEATETESN